MPWTPESFRSKHWKAATPAQAAKAAEVANAMLRDGAAEGIAIPTAIAEAKRGGKGKTKAKAKKKRATKSGPFDLMGRK